MGVGRGDESDKREGSSGGECTILGVIVGSCLSVVGDPA